MIKFTGLSIFNNYTCQVLEHLTNLQAIKNNNARLPKSYWQAHNDKLAGIVMESPHPAFFAGADLQWKARWELDEETIVDASKTWKWEG